MLGFNFLEFNWLPCFAGLSNGGSLEDGLLPSDRRTGRRHRRQKLKDGKFQPMMSEKENLELKSTNESHGECSNTFQLIITAQLRWNELYFALKFSNYLLT